MIVPAEKIFDPAYIDFLGAHKSCPCAELLPVLDRGRSKEKFFIKSRWYGDDLYLGSSNIAGIFESTECPEEIFQNSPEEDSACLGIIRAIALAIINYEGKTPKTIFDF